MFLTLFGKECKMMLKSYSYYIFVVVFVWFISSQLDGSLTEMEPPKPDQSYYGITYVQDEQLAMERKLAELSLDIYYGNFSTYPLGFIRNVKINESEKQQLQAIVEECSGKKFEDVLYEDLADYFKPVENEGVEEVMTRTSGCRVQVKESLTYEEFCVKMDQVCGIVGAGSAYEPEKMERGVSVPMSYEQAMEEYQCMLEKDHVTGAFGRLFCDYASVMLAILPVFPAMASILKDKRNKAREVIYARRASSLVILFSRYLACVAMMFLPVLIAAIVMQQPYLFHAKTLGLTADLFGFVKYAILWLLPEIMAVTATAFLIGELTNSIFGIFLQAVWAYGDLMSAATLVGGFGMRLVARWNTVGQTSYFEQLKGQFLTNRALYAVLSLLFVAVSALLYGKRRRNGGLLYGKVRKA